MKNRLIVVWNPRSGQIRPDYAKRSAILHQLVTLMFVFCFSINHTASAGTADRPAGGVIHGKTFIVERGTFEEGVLTLRQGKDFFADIEIILFLSPRQKHELPAGKTITVTSESAKNESVPAILIKWKEGNEKMPKSSEWFRRDYTMTLAFGEEQRNTLLGKINISLPDAMHSHVEGTFTANIKGFRFSHGQPDLTTDSFTTFEYVAKEYLEKKLSSQSVKIITHSDGKFKYRGPSGNTPFGFADIVYQIGNGWPSSERLQFIKDKETWRIYRTLGKNEIHEAHPFKIPGPQDEIIDQFEYLAAKKLEKEIQYKYPDKGIYDTIFTVSYNPPIKMGECGIQYSVGDKKEKFKKNYLMRLSDKGWEVDRELVENQSLNYKTGKIESK